MSDKRKVPLPRPDPRGPEPVDVRDHPTRNLPDATEHYWGDTVNALGPKAAYRIQTNQMNESVGIEDKLLPND